MSLAPCLLTEMLVGIGQAERLATERAEWKDALGCTIRALASSLGNLRLVPEDIGWCV